MEKLVDTIGKTNELLEAILNTKQREKDPNELLTMEEIVTEFKIGKVKAQKMFNDPLLPVQRYTRPFKVQRKAFNKYFEESHDYLCD